MPGCPLPCHLSLQEFDDTMQTRQGAKTLENGQIYAPESCCTKCLEYFLSVQLETRVSYMMSGFVKVESFPCLLRDALTSVLTSPLDPASSA